MKFILCLREQNPIFRFSPTRCSPAQKLSETHVFGVLWRLYYVVGHCLNHWSLYIELNLQRIPLSSLRWEISAQLSSVDQSCPTFFDPVDCSTPALPVHHQLPEPAQTHVHWVNNAIQPSHPLSPLLLLPSMFPSIRFFSNLEAVNSNPLINWLISLATRLHPKVI